MATVQLKNINKVYDNGFHAVKDANINIQDREFVVLVGPSGCGKTTTLRMVAGLEDISSGDLTIDDKRVNDVPPKDRDIAMVFQNYALYPHMTVHDNMAFGLKIRKFDKADIQARVNEAARILDIEALLDRKPKQLSGGQRQRVAVGRAIVRHPKVFLFDEPLSNLDAKLRVQMRAEISSLHTRLNATMIYVTHDQVEAMTMGDKIVVMKDGVIMQIGDPLTLYNYPTNRFVAGFIGSPAMNFLTMKVTEENGTIYGDEGNFKIELTGKVAQVAKEKVGKEIIFGIRPEDMVYAAENAPENTTISASVEVVEPLGAEIHIYVNTGSNQLVVRVPPSHMVQVGDAIKLTPNMDKVVVFDIETEEALNVDIDPYQQ
ncbi:glycerol-3-phosphate ABC transporter ATP-binding protein [Alkalispirochaeta sphaeroplastigenens]|uniref:Glycerol-3-phosphate ABC transporter ATP-binding protein n=1 Tax=Alkalispirochaeta sphaeroplastigenens TaxID=1187066 RepID=A0A2S4JI05_9SPIO|nr:sn-glycerol-3-phosphate ABC transporter ATP-binding protein UgpC [Alkalispirochaeta sphaeroplastigenens]POQ99099.1 glycerol-3-phosphate ABC transporter ATP-binding protein [Alkalispirochaeta sphaeroplastigenens]